MKDSDKAILGSKFDSDKLSEKDLNQLKKKLAKEEKIVIHDSDSNLNIFYRFSRFVQQKRLNSRIRTKPFLKYRIFSIILSKFQVSRVYRTLNQTYTILFPPKYTEGKKISRWIHRLMSYLLELFWEITFFASGHRTYNIHHFVKLKGYEHIESAIKKGRGIVAPTLHVGELFHTVSALVRKAYRDNEGKMHNLFVVIMASRENEFLFRETVKLYKHLDVVITGKIDEVRPIIDGHLKSNHLVLLMQDYSHQRQLRVPFIYGNSYYDFLMPTPQMLSHFHTNPETMSAIVPVLPIPNYKRNIKYSTVKILPEIDFYSMVPELEENSLLQKEIRRFQEGKMSQKEQYGLISLYINRKINPLILKYPFLWEEVLPFQKRTRFSIESEKIHSYSALVHELIHLFISLIDKSYEPGRHDEIIVTKLENIEKEIQNHINININKNHEKYEEGFTISEKFLDIGRLSGKNALKKIIIWLVEFCPSQLKTKMEPFIDEIKNLQKFWPIMKKNYNFDLSIFD